MIIDPKELHNTREIKIEGSEDWLKPIYEEFEKWAGPQKNRVCGSLSVKRDDYGFVQISGELRFEPQLPCSRCTERIAWPIDKTINAEYRPFNASLPTDCDLSKDELEYYYMNDDGRFSLFEIVNDTIQLAIPDRILKLAEDSQSCGICGNQAKDTHLFSSSNDIPMESPFAKLKDLLDKN